MIYVVPTSDPVRGRHLRDQAALLAQRAKRGTVAASVPELVSHLPARKIYIAADRADLEAPAGVVSELLADHLVHALGAAGLAQLEQVTLHASYGAFLPDCADLSRLIDSPAGRFYSALQQRAGRDLKMKANIGAVYCLPGGANRILKKEFGASEADRALAEIAAIADEARREPAWREFIAHYLYDKGEGRVYFLNDAVNPVASAGRLESYNTQGWVVEGSA